MADMMPLTQYMWTNDSVFELIDLVRERPILWDTSLEEHKDRVKKQVAWREVAEHFGLEKTVVEKKMRMMIGQYRREITRIAGGDTSKWFAFQKLSFLSGVQDESGGSSYPPIAAVHVGPACMSALNHNEMLEERSTFIYDEEEYSEDSTSGHKNFQLPVQRPTKRPRLDVKRSHDIFSTDTVVKMLYDEKKSRDEFVVYGEYVANKLRNIQSSLARNTAQFHINNILYKAETGQFDVFRPSGAGPGVTVGPHNRRVAGERSSEGKCCDEAETAVPESSLSLEDNSRVEVVQVKLEN